MGLTSQFEDQVSLMFGGSVEQVWNVVSDVARIGEWSPECYQISWVDGARSPAKGAVFIGRNRLGIVRWHTTCTIVDWEPGHSFAYEAHHAWGATTRWSFALREDADGVEVTQRYQTVGSPRWMVALDKLAGRRGALRRGMQSTLAAMRRDSAPHDVAA